MTISYPIDQIKTSKIGDKKNSLSWDLSKSLFVAIKTIYKTK